MTKQAEDMVLSTARGRGEGKRRWRRAWHLQRPRILALAVRLCDVGVACIALLLLSPVLLLRALWGETATGHALTRVPCIGQDGRPFELYRFAGDIPGRGLAGLFNLLVGDVSLTGPKPEIRRDDGRAQPDPVRRSVRPGLVSPYELRRRLGRDWETRAEIEREYVYRQGMLSGLACATQTLVGRALGGASRSTHSRSIALLGVRMRNTTMDEALDWIMRRVADKVPSTMAFVNPDCLNKAWVDQDYRAALAGAARVLPDGFGIHLACRMKGEALVANLNGTDLFPRLCQRAADENVRLYLLGARPGIAAAAGAEMMRRYPGLRIAGARDGYFQPDETAAVIEDINRSGAEILLVAMGAPQQERWLRDHAAALRPSVRMGVGGLFDFYSGRIRRAPAWLRNVGMEWTWRLLMEPRRMWRRYVLGNPLFLLRVWREARRAGRPSPVTSSARRRAMQQAGAQVTRIGWRLARGLATACKRSLDVIGSGAGLLLLSPVFLLCAAAIRIESPGSVLFRQRRVGRGGETFEMLKFRSMFQDAEQRLAALKEQNEMAGGVIFKMREDPRITRVGKFIRRASIDELPQLWNVFRGDMSLVGPRPPLPSEVAEYDLQDRRRLHVKPGITCIWQVSGRSDIPFEQQVELDVDYIYTQSLATDIKLLLQTVPAVVLGRGAY